MDVIRDFLKSVDVLLPSLVIYGSYKPPLSSKYALLRKFPDQKSLLDP